MGDLISGKDWIYVGVGAAVLFLVIKNSKPLSETISGAAGVVTPLLTVAGKGAEIITDPTSYETYLGGLLKAPFTTEQSWTLFKKQPGISEFINAAVTTLGGWK